MYSYRDCSQPEKPLNQEYLQSCLTQCMSCYRIKTVVCVEREEDTLFSTFWETCFNICSHLDENNLPITSSKAQQLTRYILFVESIQKTKCVNDSLWLTEGYGFQEVIASSQEIVWHIPSHKTTT